MKCENHHHINGASCGNYLEKHKGVIFFILDSLIKKGRPSEARTKGVKSMPNIPLKNGNFFLSSHSLCHLVYLHLSSHTLRVWNTGISHEFHSSVHRKKKQEIGKESRITKGALLKD